jgi:hypothetical protein
MVKMAKMTRLTLAFFLAATLASACTQIELPAKQLLRGSELVFRGTVEAQRFSVGGGETLVFHVTRVWKGHVPETFEMAVNPMSGGCTRPFNKTLDVGTDLMIFADHSMGEREFSASAEPPTDKRLQQLGPGRKPK